MDTFLGWTTFFPPYIEIWDHLRLLVGGHPVSGHAASGEYAEASSSGPKERTVSKSADFGTRLQRSVANNVVQDPGELALSAKSEFHSFPKLGISIKGNRNTQWSNVAIQLAVRLS